MQYKNVNLVSRRGLPHEFKMLVAALDYMPERMVAKLRSIFCDSKAGRSFKLTAATGTSSADLKAIGAAFDSAIMRQYDGHNGALIVTEDYPRKSRCRARLPANWEAM